MMHDKDAYGTCTGPILLDDVQCVGDEQNLGECVMSNFGEHNCDHKEDVGCKCDPNSTPSGKEGLILKLFRVVKTALSSSYNISGLVPVCCLLFQCF